MLAKIIVVRIIIKIPQILTPSMQILVIVSTWKPGHSGTTLPAFAYGLGRGQS